MNSKDYWAKREAEQLKHYITDEKEYDRQIKRIYTDTLDNVQKEIDSFYGKYAAKEGITLAEAKKRVSELDIKAYERKAARYVKDKDFSPKANEEMRLYNATMKINRLELLKANIGLELISGTEELNKYMKGILQGRTEEELKRQAGILGKTIKNNAAKAHAIVNSSFHNATFSDRVWLYQDLLKAQLSGLLQTGLIQGKNPRLLASDIKKRFNETTYNAERLMRTELARVQTEAQKQSFERNGFTMYEFIVNGGCCPICAALSGKHFKVDKMMPGENAPPMHPHCRCSTAAWEDSEDYKAWLEYLNQGGTTAEWQSMSATKKWAFKNIALTNTVNDSKIESAKKVELSEPAKKIIADLEANSVEYREISKHSKPLTETEIISRLSGGDNTSGSCASVGLAYIGQKQGYNVLDFRDGKSRDWFASKFNKIKMWDALGVKYITEDSAKTNLTNGKNILSKVEKGKEYYLSVGGHAAIVRKNSEGVLQYLELQSPYINGWKDFADDISKTLKNRFACSTSSRRVSTAFLTDIDGVTDSAEFRTILGYINTAENKQRKGSNGTIK